MKGRAIALSAAIVAGSVLAESRVAQVTPDAPFGRADAIIDLATDQGAAMVAGQWRYSDTRIVDVDHRAPGPDLKPSGAPTRAYDIEPKAGGADFDDAAWQVVPASSLGDRRSRGRLSFNWYRLGVTIPANVGAFDPTGSTVVFEIVVDDYAEIWIDGKLPTVLGQSGGALIKGWNAPNRVVVGRNVRPGQRFQIAVFGANGPLSDPPGNFIWIRSATLDFYRPERTMALSSTPARVTRVNPALDHVLPRDATIEKLAGGFAFTEGPAWHPDGYLLFSDPNENTIYRWSPDRQVSVFRTKSGYTGTDIGEYKQPGSNGLAFDGLGRLTIAEHGNRRITRIEKNGVLTVLAGHYQGHRFNSPNDLVYGPDGAIYFTDPPFGLPTVFDDPRKELSTSGVYRAKDGVVTLLTSELTGPNGLAFSPDDRFLYVGNWDEKKKVVMRYALRPDGSVEAGRVFANLTSAPGEDAIDGVKVDEQGHVYVSGPGGVWIFAADGTHLGTFTGPEHPHNMAWGDADRRTLYLTAQTGLYRIRVNIPGRQAQPY